MDVELRLSSYFDTIIERRDGIPLFKDFVAGDWVVAPEAMKVVSPIDGSTIALVPKLSAKQLEPYLEKIYRSGRWSIRNTPGYRRIEYFEKVAELLEAHADDFVEVLMVNAGKTRSQALGEVNATIDRLRKADMDARKVYGEYVPGDWDSSTLETEGLVRKEPYGLVLAISPFNYPLFDSVSKFVYSAVAGNAVILKPPSADPLPVLMFAKLVSDSGFPKDSFAVVTVPGRDMDELVKDPRIRVISFTGSSETGKHIISVAGIKQYIMELGGGDPAIVLEDADLVDAAKSIAAGIYSYAGQRCDAIKVVIAHESVYDELKRRLVDELSKVKVGDPRDPSTTMGPLISREAADAMMAAIDDAVKKGGKVIYGGRRLGDNYVEPTLIEVPDRGALAGMDLYAREVFAPVALITKFRDLDEAIEIANGRRYGLDVAIFGKDINAIRKLMRYLDFGAIYINDMPRHGVGYYPYGGRKDSGIGIEGIAYSVELVMAPKTIVFSYKGKRVYEYLV